MKIISKGLSFIGVIVLARWLGAEGYGIYAYALSWVMLLRIPATLGLEQLLIREIAIYQAQSSWGLMRGLLILANQAVLATSLTLITIAIIIIWILGLASNSDSKMFVPILLAITLLPIKSLTAVRLASIKGLHQIVKGLIPELILEPFLFLFLVGYSKFIWSSPISPAWVIGLRLVSLMIAFIVGWFILKKNLPNEIKEVCPEYQTQKWLKSSFPFMLLNGVHVINQRTDILMLGVIKGADSVGIYTVVTNGVELITFILIAINQVLAPTIASLYSEGKLEILQASVTQCARVVLAVATPIAMILVFCGSWFLSIFGSTFTQGYIALVILISGQLVNAAMGSVGFLLSMTGRERYTVISVAVSSVLNIILNGLLIPKWGIEGAAVATTSSLIFWNVLCFYWVRIKIGINPTAFKI